MFALVKSGSITKMLSGNRGITIGDLQYPKEIFTLWSKSEREAIGIYEVEMDNSKRKDDYWYINTDVTYTFGSGKVTGSYGDATARAHADTKYTNQDKTDKRIDALHKEILALKTMATQGKTSIRTLLWVGSLVAAIVAMLAGLTNIFK